MLIGATTRATAANTEQEPSRPASQHHNRLVLSLARICATAAGVSRAAYSFSGGGIVTGPPRGLFGTFLPFWNYLSVGP